VSHFSGSRHLRALVHHPPLALFLLRDQASYFICLGLEFRAQRTDLRLE